MRPGRPALAVAALALLAPSGASAQTAADLVSLGVRAYQNLDYDTAAALLRRGLGRSTGDSLAGRDRPDALTYLAATELFRGHRDSAVAAFRQVVWRDPAYRPKELIFPPRVTALFREVREATKAVAVSVAPLTELHVGVGRFTARLQVSSPHDLTVAITRVDGTPLRVVYAGPVSDTLEVGWDGRTTAGVLPADGHYRLRVTSAAGPDRGAHAVLVPLDITRVAADTARASVTPSPAALPGAHASAPIRSLATGIVAAVAVIALPTLVGRGTSGSWVRFPVAVALGASGAMGVLGRRGAPPAPPAPPAPAGAPPLSTVKTEILIIRAGPTTVFASAPGEAP